MTSSSNEDTDLRRAVRTIPDFPEPGVLFKDITPLLADSTLLRRALSELLHPVRNSHIDKVIGIESRGFILGAMLAERLNAGFVLVRKKGKLPAGTISETYSLEYGSATIEMDSDSIGDGDRVLIHDDVLATGGTAAATARLVERAGGQLVGYSFLIQIEALNGRERLADQSVHAVLTL